MDIRPARPDEMDACADLYVRVLKDTFTWLDPTRHRRADFLRAAKDEAVLVAVEEGRIVGVAAIYRPQDFLHSLYVEGRGRGVGKALLDQVIAEARGPVSLKVQAPNLRAQTFYAREGFHETERGRDGDVDWIRMVRDT